MAEESRYKLGKRIARGGMAEIFLGKYVGEEGFQRICAIKKILAHYAQDQEFVQMFRDEAHTWKRLQHANIVRVESFEEVDSSFAIIMEYVHGTDLRTLLHAVESAKQKVPIPVACHIIAEAARGLHYAHTKLDDITQQPLGIVHRDISPQNILVSYEGEIKVTDFGIAKSNNKMNETKAGIVKGKYSYMSPEQIAGSKNIDERLDVFALAVVLWEMLAMRRLFQAETEVETIQRVRNCKIEHRLKDLNPDVDDELEQIVLKGLAKDLKKRHRTAAELERELRKYMSKRFPEFTPQDIASFLKKHLEQRRVEADADVKRTLTEANARPARASKPAGRSRAVDLTVEDGPANSPNISVARPRAGQASATASGISTPPRGRGGPTGRIRMGGTSPMRGGSTNSLVLGRPSRTNHWLFGLVALAIVAVIFGIRHVSNQSAKNNAVVTLRTLPDRVRVFVDNQPKQKGQYVTASSDRPYKIANLTPGRHTIRLEREGYYPYKLELNLDDGEKVLKDDIILRKSQPHVPVRFQLRPAEGALRLYTQDRMYAGRLSAMLPTASTELIAGRPVRLWVAGDDKLKFNCVFVPKTPAGESSLLIVIDRYKRRCVAAP